MNQESKMMKARAVKVREGLQAVAACSHAVHALGWRRPGGDS